MHHCYPALSAPRQTVRRCGQSLSWIFVLMIPMSLLPLAGCGELPYLAQLAKGELATQRGTEPIDQVLASGQLSQVDADKLRMAVAARDFGAGMGLRVGNSYATFYDTSGNPTAWNISAARQDALVAKTWEFPVVGVVPYLAYFDKNMLDQEDQKLQSEGYDTMSYELDAYSSLGFLQDPIRSPMLERDPVSLVETIIHELLHNTVWRQNDTNFNESLATFVGRQGAVDFFRAEYGDASGWPALAVKFYADTDAVNAAIVDLDNTLTAYYSQPIDSATKIAGRDAVFQTWRDHFKNDVQPTLHYPDSFDFYAQFPTNNAWVLAYQRYNTDLSVFQAVYQANQGDWSATLAVFKAAAAGSGDPVEYLHTWLAGH